MLMKRIKHSAGNLDIALREQLHPEGILVSTTKEHHSVSKTSVLDETTEILGENLVVTVC